MTAFNVGDRVRVRDTPTTGGRAGMAGEVAWVTRNPTSGAVTAYNVRLERDAGLDRQSSIHLVPFRPDELEPEPEGDRR